mmetsp:Transcript_73925/g.175940  ORF Transcript_73925/g.175940 Transcript_73925/m.175940 type:complete len:484 (-) Transcript_73925:90-1541(-)
MADNGRASLSLGRVGSKDNAKVEIELAARQRELEDLTERYHRLLQENEELKKKTSVRSRIKDIFLGAPDWLRSGMDRQTSAGGSSHDDQDDSSDEEDEASPTRPVDLECVRICGSFGGTVETSSADGSSDVMEVVMPVEGDVPLVSLLPLLKELSKAVERRVAEKASELLEHKKEGHHDSKRHERMSEELEHLRRTAPIWRDLAVLLRPDQDAEDEMPKTEKDKLKQTIRTLRSDLKLSREEAKVAAETSVTAMAKVSELEKQLSQADLNVPPASQSEAERSSSRPFSPDGSAVGSDASLSRDVKQLQAQLAAAKADAARFEGEASNLRLKNAALSKFLASAEMASMKLKESLGAEASELSPTSGLGVTGVNDSSGAPPRQVPSSWAGGLASRGSSTSMTPPRFRTGAMDFAARGAYTAPGGPLIAGSAGRTTLLDPHGVLRQRPPSRSPAPSTGRATPKDEVLKDQVRELERWAQQLKALHK